LVSVVAFRTGSEVCWARVAVHGRHPNTNYPALAHSLQSVLCLFPTQSLVSAYKGAPQQQSLQCSSSQLVHFWRCAWCCCHRQQSPNQIQPGKSSHTRLVRALQTAWCQTCTTASLSFGLSILWTAGSCCLATLLPPRQTSLFLTHYCLLMQGTRWDPTLLVSWRLGREGGYPRAHQEWGYLQLHTVA
jgi:hypothetical protein